MRNSDLIYNNYHKTRFRYDKKRVLLWKALYEYHLKDYIKEDYCVLELGAGFGYFINNVQCRKRIAVDIWEEFQTYLDSSIVSKVCNIAELDFIENNSVDFVFASNVFEHVSKLELIRCLNTLKKKLKDGGTLNIIQPNFKYAFKEYFDDFTHETIYTDIGLSDLLESQGYIIIEKYPKYLPFKINSKTPSIPILIKLYLKLPIKPFGKQMFIRGRLEKNEA